MIQMRQPFVKLAQAIADGADERQVPI
jgi:hypothetical protein